MCPITFFTKNLATVETPCFLIANAIGIVIAFAPINNPAVFTPGTSPNNGKEDIPSKLYATLILEPYLEKSQSFKMAVYIPADWRGKIYVYEHNDDNGSMFGLSALSDKILSTKKEYKKGQSGIIIAGLKTWNKTIDGVPRKFGIGIGVAVSQKNTKPKRNRSIWRRWTIRR